MSVWSLVQDYENYVDFETVVDVGDDSVLCRAVATWDRSEGCGEVIVYATADGGATEIFQHTLSTKICRDDFCKMVGDTLKEV
jgi:hypothetical protein